LQIGKLEKKTENVKIIMIIKVGYEGFGDDYMK
jgi:hypothetical protein